MALMSLLASHSIKADSFIWSNTWMTEGLEPFQPLFLSGAATVGGPWEDQNSR